MRRRSRRPQRPAREEDEARVNRQIRVPRIVLIDEEGKRLGEFLTSDALTLAQERGLDLVEVAPDARPPICRMVDYGKLKYEKKKKASATRRNQVLVQLKEVKMRPKTDDHDMEFKVKHVRRFLDDGNKVKITVRFRGREMAHRDIGRDLCFEVFDLCRDLATVELEPRMEGRQMFMILAPVKKKQPKAAKPGRSSRDGKPSDDEEEDDDEREDIGEYVDNENYDDDDDDDDGDGEE